MRDTVGTGEEMRGGVANAGEVVRIGDLISRPAPQNVRTLHRFLDHLNAKGFPSPKPVDIDEDRELLTFIPGETSVPPYPHEWVRTSKTLKALGRLVRAFHDATADFPRHDNEWPSDLADPHGGPVICHNDICVENVVFSTTSVAGLLDFDFAAPGRPVWDLAMTARYWVPLQDPTSAATTGRAHLDPLARVRELADAYRADDEMRQAFTATLFEIEDVALRFVRDRLDRQVPAFVAMWNDLGGQERQNRKMAWLEDNRRRVDLALLE